MSRYADPGTLRIKAFEMRVVDVDLEHDPSWRTELQRHAVAKLNRMEIEALSLEKYEIERRMADD